MGSQSRLAGVGRVGIDTSPFIYYFEGTGGRGSRAIEIFKQMGSAAKVTSIVTAIEVLTFCQGTGHRDLADRYRTMFRESGDVQVVVVDWAVTEEAARLRGAYRLRLGDSIQVATAIVRGCGIFLTNDRALARVAEIPVLVFDDLVP